MNPESTVVRRRRLIARLHELVHLRLLLVVAPAGYGKTTLLEDFAASCAEGNVALTLCRYTAASWDADGIGLLEGVARAFLEQFPGAGERTLGLLTQARAGVAAAELERLLASAVGLLAQEVAERAPDYTLLVVDDYHLLDESESTRRLVAALLERLPAHVHVALLSRTVPALDTAALIAEGQAAALGPRDLAFSEAELALFLVRRYGIEAEPALLEEVRRWTEGWITGLLLAMPALPSGLTREPEAPARRLEMLVRTLSGARRGGVPLSDYLAAEMLRRQAPEDRDLLLAAALPDEVEVAQLDEALEASGGSKKEGAEESAERRAAALARLERGGVPLSPAPERPGVYRLHALVRQYLRTHLERSDPARHEKLRRRWAEVAAAHGRPDAALEHALAARWWARACALLEQHGDEWIYMGRHRFMEVALAALPVEVMAAHPRVQVCRSRLTHARGDYPEAREQAREAFFNARARRDRQAEARALLLEAMALLSSGRAAEAQELCVHALEHPVVRRESALQGEAYRSLGLVEGIRGLSAPAAEHLQRAADLYEALGRRWEVAKILTNLGVVLGLLGRPIEAERCHRRALAIRRDLGDPFGISLSLNNLAMLSIYRGALEEARTLLGEAIERSERAGHTVGAACWRVTLGDVLRAQHHVEEALGAYQEARAVIAATADPRWAALALIGEAAAQLNLGNVDACERLARETFDIATGGGLREIEGHAHVLFAAAALRHGQRREVNRRLELARLISHETGSRELQARVHLWSGLNALQQRRSTEAAAALQIAAEAAAALGGPTALAIEGPVMEPLLRAGLSRGVAPDLVTRALDMLPRSRPSVVRETRAGGVNAPRTRAAGPRTAPGVLPALQIQLLGEFAVHVGGELTEEGLSARSRTRELLAYLAVFPEGRRRDEVTADLWPEAESGQDKTLIQTTVHRLRQALFHEAIVTGEGEPYRLNPEVPLDVDVRRFEQSVAAARAAARDPETRTAHLVEAVGAYGGPFLSGSYADWAEFLRRRLEREYVAALAQLVKTDWEAREYRRCLDWCHRLIQVEPEDQEIHTRIVACYEALGEPLAAGLHRRRRAAADQEEEDEDEGGATRNMV